LTTFCGVSYSVDKGEVFTLEDLITLVQAALKADLEPETPVFANVKFSITTPAPVKTLTIGDPNG